MEKSPPKNLFLVFFASLAGLGLRHVSGRLPIGNGHAPGIEIDRCAIETEADVEGGAGVAVAGRSVSLTGSGFAAVVGVAVFFAAIVFAGFLAALRAAGFAPAAFFLPGFATTTFFAAGRALFATLRLIFFFAGFFLAAADLPRAAIFFATTLRVLALRAMRFTALRTGLFTAFLAADFFFAAIRSPPVMMRGTAQILPSTRRYCSAARTRLTRSRYSATGSS
jgi:hypothetical protein